jgi:hypothetical protein
MRRGDREYFDDGDPAVHMTFDAQSETLRAIVFDAARRLELPCTLTADGVSVRTGSNQDVYRMLQTMTGDPRWAQLFPYGGPTR